jgi:molybdate transport system permease protein
MEWLSADLDLRPLWLSLKLAALTVIVLLLLGLPLAWWLSRSRARFKVILEAIIALPLVLPPTVLGFYLLILMGSQGMLGAAWAGLTGQSLAFSFAGLLIASCLYSLPFVIQPLQASFAAIEQSGIEAAWTLGASRLKTFFTVILPQSRQGLLAAIVLGFAHTLGEFGVVLMVGGNIPGETQVLAIAIYDQVEGLQYQNAHILSAGLLLFSFVVLAVVYGVNRRWLIEVRG